MLDRLVDVYYGMNDNDYFRIDSRTLFSAIYYSYADYITNPYLNKVENVFNGLNGIEELIDIINNSEDEIVTLSYSSQEDNELLYTILDGLRKKINVMMSY